MFSLQKGMQTLRAAEVLQLNFDFYNYEIAIFNMVLVKWLSYK